jgi:ABC-2 type transport system permease protein
MPAMQKEAQMNKFKMPLIIMKRELSGYFSSPVAYIVISVFLIFSGFFFFKDFFYLNQADMRSFFQMLPLIFTFVIPAVTMRLFAEEKHSGTLEVLMTLPVTTREVVLGKLMAGTVFSWLMMAPTLAYAVTVIAVGRPDAGPIIGGYLGALLLGAAYSSIGVLASSITKNQIIAFIAALSFSFFLWLIDKIMVYLPSWTTMFDYLGADYHFQNIARGIIDLRDITYFASLIIISVLVTEKVIEERR